jgi:curved DNA-binding protein CbpA
VEHTAEQTRALLARELERVRKADAFRVLQVPLTAGPQEVRAAFLRAVKRFHPTRYACYESEIGELATEVFLRIQDAYAEARKTSSKRRRVAHGTQSPVQERAARGSAPTRSDAPAPRARGSASHRIDGARMERARARAAQLMGRPPAFGVGTGTAERKRDEAFVNAKAMLARGAFGDAREAFRLIALTAPHEKKYRAYMHLAWGREHAAAGKPDEARAELQRAIKLAPDLTAAKDALDKLPKSSGGLFKRLFRK